MKAKGLTRKRKKEDRTPRVKKRHQYEKLMVKHRKAVQEYKPSKELYSGQKDGFKAGIKKSTKLS
jgi:U3 small nucleolar RNA-associated protein 3